MIKELLEYIRYEMTEMAKFKFEIAIWILLFSIYGVFFVYYWHIYHAGRKQLKQLQEKNLEIMQKTIDRLEENTQKADWESARMIFRLSLTNKPSQ